MSVPFTWLHCSKFNFEQVTLLPRPLIVTKSRWPVTHSLIHLTVYSLSSLFREQEKEERVSQVYIWFFPWIHLTCFFSFLTWLQLNPSLSRWMDLKYTIYIFSNLLFLLPFDATCELCLSVSQSVVAYAPTFSLSLFDFFLIAFCLCFCRRECVCKFNRFAFASWGKLSVN